MDRRELLKLMAAGAVAPIAGKLDLKEAKKTTWGVNQRHISDMAFSCMPFNPDELGDWPYDK